MVSGMHRLLLREGRNNRSNPDFQTFFEGFSSNFMIKLAKQKYLRKDFVHKFQDGKVINRLHWHFEMLMKNIFLKISF